MRPSNYGGLYTIFVVIGVGSFVLLPVALEIGVEVTSSAESSSAIFWCGANILSVVFVEVSRPFVFHSPSTDPLNLIFPTPFRDNHDHSRSLSNRPRPPFKKGHERPSIRRQCQSTTKHEARTHFPSRDRHGSLFPTCIWARGQTSPKRS